MTNLGKRKEMVATVISDRMDSTIIVETKSHVVHPKYKKVFVRRSKFSVHDEKGVAKLGDTVRVRSCRPVSKAKHWRLVEVIRAAKARPEERGGRPKRKSAEVEAAGGEV
jgi:small subunit ribosomal protein S17